MWGEGGLGAALKLAELYHTKADVIEQHIHLPIFKNTVTLTDVEVHFVPSVLKNPIADRHLQKWFRAQEAW